MRTHEELQVLIDKEIAAEEKRKSKIRHKNILRLSKTFVTGKRGFTCWKAKDGENFFMAESFVQAPRSYWRKYAKAAGLPLREKEFKNINSMKGGDPAQLQK